MAFFYFFGMSFAKLMKIKGIMMRYGKLFCETIIPQELIDDTLAYITNLKLSTTQKNSNNVNRSSKVNFIGNSEILRAFLDISLQVNKLSNWDLNIDGIEPLQYGEYHENGEYGWHVDQHDHVYKDNRVRKLSFSIFLNNNYEGGEFDLEVYNPVKDKRYITYSNKVQTNTALFFQSDYWHRVRPVQKGIRK